MLRTRFPITLLWGPEFVLVYNEAYVELIGDNAVSREGGRGVRLKLLKPPESSST